jgi:4-phytase / acid phosphatase
MQSPPMPHAANAGKSLSHSFILFSFLLLPFAAQGPKTAVSDDDQIQAVIVLARHGVRAPIESETRSSAYNAQPWPSWPVAAGVLTSHGTQALKLLGEYYRSRYPSLLQHIDCDHASYTALLQLAAALICWRQTITIYG